MQKYLIIIDNNGQTDAAALVVIVRSTAIGARLGSIVDV
jgi:hypothetical protein